MTFEVLISCMYQKGFSIIYASQLEKVKATIINQTDIAQDTWFNDEKGHKRLDTKTRGLSVSRNMAVNAAESDICLICDDDECFVDGLEEKVLSAYRDYPDADMICFMLDCPESIMPRKAKKINYITALKIVSCQISFWRDRIINADIHFDTNFGSGTEIGSGEENIFLYDCLRKKLKIYYVPIKIGRIDPSESKWFKGFSEESFVNHGKKVRRMMGRFWGLLYCTYFSIAKYSRYKKYVTFSHALSNMIKGLNYTF